MLIFDQFKKSDRPLWFLTVVVLAGLLVLLGGLWYIQGVSSRKYVESLRTQSFRKVRYPALRGRIMDRNGMVLADNRPSFNVNLYLEELSGSFQEAFREKQKAWRAANPRKRMAKAERDELGRLGRFSVVSNLVLQLGQQLNQPLALDPAGFLKHYTNRLALPMPILENLPQEKVLLFEEQPNRLPGLSLDFQPMRTYLHGTLAAHLLGQVRMTERVEAGDGEPEIDYDYCLPDCLGLVGVEGAFDNELRGSAGVKAILVNHLGYRQSEKYWSEAEPGCNVVLTIDWRIQKIAEQALQAAKEDVRGAVVVVDCRSGDILAMASAPTFDPNQFIPRIKPDDWAKLSDEERNPTLNRATFGAYTPGSIFKIVVALAGLECGTITPADIYASQGHYQLGKRLIKDTAGSGDFNLRRALVRSSNSYFIEYGLRMGLPRLMDMSARFCLGQRTKVPLRQEVAGFFPTPAWVEKMKEQGTPIHIGEIANLCFGQGQVTVTPLQMAMMTAAVANGGKVLWPRLVDRIEAPGPAGSRLVKTFPAGAVRNLLGVNPANLEVVREAMLADVEDRREGTGCNAAVPGFRVTGKTGTAQVMKNNTFHHYNTWFVSFGPYENPKYAMAILVEYGASGGATCAPVARKIYELIKQLDENPNYSLPEKPIYRPAQPARKSNRAAASPPAGQKVAMANPSPSQP